MTKGPKPGGVRQLHVNFSDGAYEALQELCEAQSKTMTEVLRDAITLERWVQQIRDEGGRLLVEQRDGSRREVILLR